MLVVRISQMGTPGKVAIFLAVFAAINVIGFAMMRHDKRAAIRGEYRVPEARLIVFALLGGALGMRMAQRRYRHKTVKQPFAAKLLVAVVMNVTVVTVLLAEVATGRVF